MSIAEQLIEEVIAFGKRNPGHDRSLGALIDAIRRIDAHFTGKTRKKLLHEARDTFLKQIEILETADRTRAALEKLEQNHHDLTQALDQIDDRAGLDMARPDGVTLH